MISAFPFFLRSSHPCRICAGIAFACSSLTLTKMNLRNFNLSSSNSLLHLVGTRIRPGYPPLAKYFWDFGYKDYVEFSVSFPRVQYIGTSSCTFQLSISLSTYGDPSYRSLVAYQYTYGEVIITNSYTDVIINTKRYYIGPFITQINGKIAKSPLTGKYNYFINNILVKSDVTSAPSATLYRDWETDRKSTRLNSSHRSLSRMPSSA